FRPDGSRVTRTASCTVETRVKEGKLSASAFGLRSITEESESDPRFRNATREAGLGAPRRDPAYKLTNRLIEGLWPGSGVAVLDFDGDGFEDLFVGDGVSSILYKNDGKGHFTDVTAKAGLSGVPATGIAAGDLDGDGFPDLVVTDAFGIEDPAHKGC